MPRKAAQTVVEVEEEVAPAVFTSPLKPWPGKITLPPLLEFDGEMWNHWADCVEDAPVPAGPGGSRMENRLYCYAGLMWLESYGRWEMDIDRKEVLKWAHSPKAERMLLVNWLGRVFRQYMQTLLLNPKG